MKTAFLLTLTCLWLLPDSVFAAASPQIHVSKKLFAAKSGCVQYLEHATTNALLQLQALDSRVYLGTFDELERLLRRAGASPSKAGASVRALNELRKTAFQSPTLEFSAAVYEDLIQAEKILICAVGSDCALAHADENTLFFTDQHEGLVLLPPPMGTVQEFAVNFFGTLASVAGERILISWLIAGHEKELETAGSADALYREFASHYDGAVPPTSGSMNQGFAITFMSLFQTFITQELYALMRPDLATQNAAHLSTATYEHLLFGQNRELTAPIMRKLGITQQNLFVKTQALLATMLNTIQQQPNR